MAFTTGATYTVELNGTVVGTDYDQLHVTGSVTLDDATLIDPRLGGEIPSTKGSL